MSNIKEFVKLAQKPKPTTYRGLLLQHLRALTKEQKELRVDTGFIVVETSQGLGYSNLLPTTIYSMIGMLELIKAQVVFSAEEDFDEDYE